jgi:hypothetical protein
MAYQVETPVALLVFNRPAETERVFARIRQAAPSRLLIVADGPRPDRAEDAARCAAVRHIVAQVDWPCAVEHQFADTNLGCRRRVSSGLDWVFARCERAIILEDDCLPASTFFRFCDEMLAHFANDTRVMHVGGSNFGLAPQSYPHSYAFSCLNHIWGWATWRRAWRYYDVTLAAWPTLDQEAWLAARVLHRPAVDTWRTMFQSAFEGQLDTWDVQWTFACWQRNGLSVLPARNQIANIGFSAEATHTRGRSPWADLPTHALDFPLVHPTRIACDERLDLAMQRALFSPPGIWRRLARSIRARWGVPA